MTRAALLVATLTLAFVVVAPQAGATVVTGFMTCVNCSAGDPQAIVVEVELSDEGVPDGGLFTVEFDITSGAGLADPGKLLDAYFEAPEWSDLTIGNLADVGYVTPGTPGDPPGFDAWTTTAISISAQPSSSPPSITGFGGAFDVALTLVFFGTLGTSFAEFANNVIAQVSGSLISVRFGGCTESGDSCTTVAAPIPGAIWLFVSALLGLVGIGYRKREKLAAA